MLLHQIWEKLAHQYRCGYRLAVTSVVSCPIIKENKNQKEVH